MFNSDSELQGAEPIFLHLLRPLLKPYTPTLDLLLDFVRMVGDIFFTMVTIPVNFVATSWWSSMFSNEENSDSEAKGIRGSYVEATLTNTRGESHIQIRTPSQNTRTSRTASSNGLTHAGPSHQIWYPPPSYDDNEDDTTPRSVNGTATSHAVQSDIAYMLEAARREQEQWRQYPAFPSAYPPTPAAISVSGLPTIPPSHLSNILEHPSQRDFRESLLPPKQPLDLSLSDEHIPRARSNNPEDTPPDPDSDGEDEDAFNVTLATPMVRARTGALLQLDRAASIASTAASVRSRSTALSTTDNVSSLRTRSSSESLSSTTLSPSDLSLPSRKKRPLPQDRTAGPKLTSRLLEVPQGRRPREMPGTTRTAWPSNEDLGSKTSSADSENIPKPDHSKRRRIVAAAQPPQTRARAVRHTSTMTQSDASNIQPRSRERNELAGRRTGSATSNGSAQAGLPPNNPTRPVATRKPRPAPQGVKEQGKERIR